MRRSIVVKWGGFSARIPGEVVLAAIVKALVLLLLHAK
jgi:hypothetical protein